jgi:hypothetical protein
VLWLRTSAVNAQLNWALSVRSLIWWHFPNTHGMMIWPSCQTWALVFSNFFKFILIFFFYLIFFVGTGFELRVFALGKQALCSSSHTSSVFCSGYFGDGISRAICLGCSGTCYLPSLSQSPWITGMSHWCLAGLFEFLRHWRRIITLKSSVVQNFPQVGKEVSAPLFLSFHLWK